MLQAANTDLFNHLRVSKTQNLPFPLQIKQVKSAKASLRIFIFRTLGTLRGLKSDKCWRIWHSRWLRLSWRHNIAGQIGGLSPVHKESINHKWSTNFNVNGLAVNYVTTPY